MGTDIGTSATHGELLAEGLSTVADAAKFLSIGKTTLYEAMERGELVYVKIGRARRIPRRALLQFAANNLRGGWAQNNGEGAAVASQN